MPKTGPARLLNPKAAAEPGYIPQIQNLGNRREAGRFSRPARKGSFILIGPLGGGCISVPLAELGVEKEDRRAVVPGELQFVEDLGRRLLFLYLLVYEPLKLDSRRVVVLA